MGFNQVNKLTCSDLSCSWSSTLNSHRWPWETLINSNRTMLGSSNVSMNLKNRTSHQINNTIKMHFVGEEHLKASRMALHSLIYQKTPENHPFNPWRFLSVSAGSALVSISSFIKDQTHKQIQMHTLIVWWAEGCWRDPLLPSLFPSCTAAHVSLLLCWVFSNVIAINSVSA